MKPNDVTTDAVPTAPPLGAVKAPTSTGAVQEMFNSIAGTYDLLNTVLSGGMHKVWEGRVVAALPTDPAEVVLDLCTGTGALVPRLAKRFRKVVAADISPKMLEVGRKRWQRYTSCEWVEANAQSLPFGDESFDATTVAYGVRNLPQPVLGLSEMYRVTRPGGTLVVLEFGQPLNPVWRWLFGLYSRYVIPFIGGVISGERRAYEYLPSTSAHFPCGVAFEQMLAQAGWTPVTTTPLMGGVAFIYTARRGAV
jgi:demethylmenaquinone methyltransferase/2-methoxy-6-polyprenyl-1,4-benzoquinol methylase